MEASSGQQFQTRQRCFLLMGFLTSWTNPLSGAACQPAAGAWHRRPRSCDMCATPRSSVKGLKGWKLKCQAFLEMFDGACSGFLGLRLQQIQDLERAAS